MASHDRVTLGPLTCEPRDYYMRSIPPLIYPKQANSFRPIFPPMEPTTTFHTRAIRAVALLLACGGTALAQINNWDGVGGAAVTGPNGLVYGKWTDGANWDHGDPFGSSKDDRVGTVEANGGRIWMDQEFWVTPYIPSSKLGAFSISGGTLQLTDGVSIYKTPRVGDGAASTNPGIVTQTGGTLYMNRGEMRIGSNITLASYGLYDISGGEFSTADGLYPGGNIVLGSRLNQFSAGPTRGELRISGTAVVNLAKPLGAPAQALLFGAAHGEEGSSVLTIIGSAATVNIDSLSMVNNYPTYNAGLIQFQFDQTGPSTIHLARFANLAQGVLNIDYTGPQLPSGAYFDLMIADQISISNSFVLDPNDAFDWQLVKLGDGQSGGPSDILRLVYLGGQPAYALWSAAHAGGQKPDLDFDQDGVPNGVEFFMGQTGASFTALPSLVAAAGVTTWTWPRDPGAIADYTFQMSADLQHWTDFSPPDASIDTSHPGQVIFTLPRDTPLKFGRLVVTPKG